jgi:hypothetical protein
MAAVYSFNDASIRLHESLGFQREGRWRRMGYSEGQYFDLLFYGLTVEEFIHTFLLERNGSGRRDIQEVHRVKANSKRSTRIPKS